MGFAAVMVLLGVAIAVAEMRWAHLSVEAAVGILCGAVTNTPGLGSAQQALKDLAPTGGPIAVAGSGCAVAYPFGIFGLILAMMALRRLFKVDLGLEQARLDAERAQRSQEPHTFSVRLTNPDLVGLPALGLPALCGVPVAVSRLLRGGMVIVPQGGEPLMAGDVLQVVCAKSGLERIRAFVGEAADTDLRRLDSGVGVRKILVSRASGAQALAELRILERHAACVTRILRSGVEFVPDAHASLHIGDQLTVVGPEAGLAVLALEMGDSRSKLDHPNLIPVFAGILVGVLLGAIPISLPGLPSPVRLGLAGGPMVVALLMGYQRRLGSLHFYIPNGAVQFMREFGILLFLVAVGLESGNSFWAALASGEGLRWMALGALITFIPSFLVGAWARWRGYDYLSITGLLSGAMTDPPALGYANSLAPSQAPSVAYASVYPIAMFLRVMTAQAFVLYFFRG
jgi:putative transport protein